MEQSSRPWTRRLIVAVVLVVGLLAAALPASAAPTTKNYSAALGGGVNGGQQVTVPTGTTANAVTLVLTNQPDSQQSFGSAQLDFTGSPLPTGVSAPGWTSTPASTIPNGVRFRLISSPTGTSVAPGASIPVTITMPATAGATELRTQVKQSNDFRGINNDFTLVPLPTQPLTIVTAGPSSTPCAGTCTPTFTSNLDGVRADLTVTSPSSFTYIAGFTPDRLRCDTIPFGPTVTPEPFRVDTVSTSPVAKTIVLTFPKALANLVPDNGTPRHPVCAGADVPFPGSSPVGVITHPHEGLLLDCSDPAYVAAVAAADPAAFLPMCVASRSRSAGKLVVTVSIAATTVDPRVW